MRYILTLYFIVILISCSHLSTNNLGIKTKLSPEYYGVDPVIKPIVDEYLELSTRNSIAFTHKVTIGLKDIGHGRIVGLCHYGINFREIDIDKTFWDHSSYNDKRILVYHELTHCYCGRGHDYGEGKNYPEASLLDIFKDTIFEIKDDKGKYDDGCPLSIMYPYVLKESCFEKHLDSYTIEMFDRCNPY